MTAAPGSRDTDRVRANCWLRGNDLRYAIAQLSWAYSALRPMVGASGSSEREIFDNAARGFSARVDYILDSLDRLLDEKEQT